MKIKLQLADLLILITVASCLFNVVFNNLPAGLGSTRFWAPMALISIIITRFEVLTISPCKYVVFFGISSVVILQYTLWKHMGDLDIHAILFEFSSLFTFTVIWGYYFLRHDFKRLAFISKWLFIFIIITLVMTNIALSIDPLIVRNSAFLFGKNIYQVRLFKLTGAAGYGYAQAFILLIPILIYHIKNRKKMVFSHKVLIVILIGIIITTLRAQVFANVLVTVAVSILAIMGSKKKYLAYIYLAITFIIIMIIPISFYVQIITELAVHVDPDTELYRKLNDFALFIEYPEIDNSTATGYRTERYPMLFEALSAKPFFGIASYKRPYSKGGGGQHLYWMYRLALWGVTGFLFFIYVLNKIYKSITSVLVDSEVKFYYFLSVLAYVMFGLIKNISGREPLLFIIVVIPGLYFLPLLEKDK